MSYIIYKITKSAVYGDGRSYVGVTVRGLRARLKAHFYEAARNKGVSKHSLGSAIRYHLKEYPGIPLETAFSIIELARVETKDEARAAEKKYILQQGTLVPNGYNVMQGGESLGGPSNSLPCELCIDGEHKRFSSFSAAARAVAKSQAISDKEEVDRYIWRAKMRAWDGWTQAEALGLDRREDGRSTEISRRAKERGVGVSTLRSKAYRLNLKAKRLLPPGSIDRLPDPYRPGFMCSPRETYRMLGISFSTGRYRLRQIESKIESLDAKTVLLHLSTTQDRTKKFLIRLPGGSSVLMGVNQLARKYERPGLGISAIKARLRKLGSYPSNMQLLEAIGLKAHKS